LSEVFASQAIITHFKTQKTKQQVFPNFNPDTDAVALKPDIVTEERQQHNNP